MHCKLNRKDFLKKCSALTTGSLIISNSSLFASSKIVLKEPGLDTILINPKPLFEISPYLYMQFMEPLGITDSSVEAAWDYDVDDWRKDLTDVVKGLAPDVIRWGGNFTRFYKWREGVGPVKDRPFMYNYSWGGKETNRVGTHEFVDFCRRVGAEPLMCVNFMSDGIKRHWNTIHGENRRGDAKEAADWVSYANDPDNKDRKRHGVDQPYNIKLWQIGNETSYLSNGFDLDQAISHTIEFAKAMRKRDPSIKLIGWGDDRRHDKNFWARDMLKHAGEYLDFIAMHMMGMSPRRENTVLTGFEYQKEPEQAWEELLELTNIVESKVNMMREIVNSQQSDADIAITEGHLSLRPHNANPILHEWLSALYHARTMNIYQRNGDKVKICTGADFCGTRWTVNAVKMQVPRGVSYLMPVGSIMRLFNKHNGKYGIEINSAPSDLDIAASRSENKIYLHVANRNYRKSVEAAFSVQGMKIVGGRVFEIAPEDPRLYVNQDQPNVFEPKEKVLPSSDGFQCNFPRTSVSVVELDLMI